MSTTIRRVGNWKLWVLAAVMGGTFGLAGLARATDYTWYVDQAATGNGSGTNWANACTNIQKGIDTATAWLIANYSGSRDNMNTNDAIYVVVRAGTYAERIFPGRKPTNENDGLAGSTNGAWLYIQSELWDSGGKSNTIVVIPDNKRPDVVSLLPAASGSRGLANFAVRGFTFREDSASGAGYWLTINDFANGPHVIEHNIFDAAGAPLGLWYAIESANDAVIRHNIFRGKRGVGGGNDLVMLQINSRNTVFDNLIFTDGDTAETRRWWRGREGGSSCNVFSNNLCVGEGISHLGGIDFVNSGAAVQDTNNLFVGNVFWMGPPAYQANTNDTGNVFINNTFYSGNNFLSRGEGDTVFNNLFIGFFYDNNFIYEGATNNASDAIDAQGNYVRAPTTLVRSLVLPAGYTNLLPSEIFAANPDFMQPTNLIAGAIASREGYTAPKRSINGIRSGDAQIGAVFVPSHQGTQFLIR
ncbi:MAG: hypothetical protein PHR35_03335 [Kiritimatiellae bacterium]|nr:hypothetical protein [Kiritimatiellia bacterium]